MRATYEAVAAALAAIPGVTSIYSELCERYRVLRPVRWLPQAEREVENAILRLLGGGNDGGAFWRFVEGGSTCSGPQAPRRYRPFLPILL